MSVQMRTVPLTSEEILQELIMDSLPNILGASYELISNNLPFEGNHVLCLDSEKHPTVVTYDNRDAGRALLAGLAVIDGLTDNRGMLYRLYPALFRGNEQRNSAIFRLEDIRLIVLSSRPPPGVAYLEHAFRSLTAYTFRILEVEGKIGLLIEPPHRHADNPANVNEFSRPALKPAFRSGSAVLSPGEEAYFEGA